MKHYKQSMKQHYKTEETKTEENWRNWIKALSWPTKMICFLITQQATSCVLALFSESQPLVFLRAIEQWANLKIDQMSARAIAIHGNEMSVEQTWK
jgi:hypothetical protein